jgi:hypothetical protein
LCALWGMTSRKALEELLPWMRKGEIGALTPQLMQRLMMIGLDPGSHL